MPIPWLVVLQAVPWTDVIKNAPRVADGAKKLWNSVRKKAPDNQTLVLEAQPVEASDLQPIEQLQARINGLEAATTSLHNQMLASSELITTLADQNSQLVAKIEALSVRNRRLTWALFVVAGVVMYLALR